MRLAQVTHSHQVTHSQMMRYSAFVGSMLLATAGLAAGGAIAQSLSACEPPLANEYLLLVPNEKPETEEQLRQLLPSNAVLTACDYLNDEVMRVGGFASVDIASAWAQYLNDMAGLQAFVARPAGTTPTASAPTTPPSDDTSLFPAPTQTPASGGTSSPAPESVAQDAPSSFPAPTQIPPDATPAPAATPSPASDPSTAATNDYNPQSLGSGYAVLVSYFNRPEVATDVHQVTSQPVGLVSYEQQPFLLAAHTADAAAATSVLQTLSDRGFTVQIVDARRAILLTPAVAGTEG
ncbi:MAG: hypothetical protein HC769_11110 [Cyanobacteria bacterium CRU_2_1]|nr:hypothetical protein [Cyanobacteria bacterium RU_5_0]NJR59342.1 hypothetical protein [Cyanobacteria bacterium CRU_2_1]